MFETISGFASYLENITWLTYPVVLLLGFLAGMSAITCSLPILPAMAGFVMGGKPDDKKFIAVPFFIMLGSVVTLAAFGAIVSFFGLTLQKSLGLYWPYFVGIVCIMAGLLVLGVLKLPANIKIPEMRQGGFIGSFVFGLALGGVMAFGSSCCLPVLPVILTYTAINGRPVEGALILGVFAVGQSIPLFAIGLFSKLLGRVTIRWSKHVRRAAGIMLLITGVYFIWKG